MGNASRPRKRNGRTATSAIASLLVLAGSASAQSPEAEQGRATFRGVVRDAVSGSAVAGARVHLERSQGGTLTDSTGGFELVAGTGAQELAVEQYGYEGVLLPVDVRPETDEPFEVRLEPLPVMLEGVTVVADRLATMERRLEGRQRAAPVPVRAFDLDRLVRSRSWDMEDFLQYEASVRIVPCARGAVSSRCIFRRGSRSGARVFIDEAPIVGGLDQLALYHPHEFYLVEVYARGRVIRAYTHWFMDRMARQPIALLPFDW